MLLILSLLAKIIITDFLVEFCALQRKIQDGCRCLSLEKIQDGRQVESRFLYNYDVSSLIACVIIYGMHK